MIEVRELTRRYGTIIAVDAVSLLVEEGEIVGLLGPNGAGKTTLLRMVTGFLPPTSGHVRVAGRDMTRDSLAARRSLGYLPENVALYPELRVGEYLAYRAQLEGLPRSRRAAAIDRAVERCLLTEVRNQVIGTLSKGYRQRVGLAAAILHQPPVLVLDEPTVGLDPKQIIAIRQLIRELAREATLLLSTHILPEVELLCDRVVILDRARIVAEGTPETLSERWRGEPVLRVAVEAAPGAAGVADALAAVPGVTAVEVDETQAGRFRLRCEGEPPAAEVFRLAVERGWVLVELVAERISLEDVFVHLTTQEATGTEGDREPSLPSAEEPGVGEEVPA
ncbi:MAG: ABC transporter ATP-binding protein [Thermoanaerobaculia bacterium]